MTDFLELFWIAFKKKSYVKFEIALALPGHEGWILQPKDLGLKLISLDATARRKARSTSAQIRVRYQPTGEGTEDEQLLNFRYGDWTQTWFVVTRKPDLGGYLEYEWKETIADGSVIKHPVVKTDQSDIVL